MLETGLALFCKPLRATPHENTACPFQAYTLYYIHTGDDAFSLLSSREVKQGMEGIAGASSGSANHVHWPLQWFVWACAWWWKQRGLVWGTIIVDLLTGIVATWLFTDPSTLKKLPFGGVMQNPYPVLIVFVIFLSLTVISGIGSRVPVAPARRVLLRRYVTAMINDTELLTLRGIPAGLIAESVPLDQVFIPLQLHPNRPRTDYPLSDVELQRFREILKGNEPVSSASGRDLERVVIEAEKNWQHVLKSGDRIGVADVWQQLTSASPVAVIQGYPGMGKSTLMERLALYMARRNVRFRDPTMPDAGRLQPTLFPLLIRLGKYDTARNAKAELTLDEYIPQALGDLGVAQSTNALFQSLATGRCLVIFEGLDEVSELERRQHVQEAIKTFILCHRNIETTSSYNRFLITSRVAGYDQAAFPDFRHYTIAELTDEQINWFLPQWSRANANRQHEASHSRDTEQKAVLEKEVERKVEELETAIQGNQAVRDLAKNPLVLTLLVVMQQNSITLPQRRIELYKTVTLTLLENRKIAKGLPTIPENLAIKYLGPLAFIMQEHGNNFARERDVLASFQQSMRASDAKLSEDDARQAAITFLARIRERGGLFVQRTGDYFGFMHRTFQEYFAARYLLNQIKEDQTSGIADFVQRACNEDATWREPFLLAVAYQSAENEKIADEILRKLLDAPQGTNQAQRLHHLLLATECVIEAKPLSIDTALERDIATQLLLSYEEAQRERRFADCQQIESMLQRWLLSLPRELPRVSIVSVLREMIADVGNIPLQRAALTMLTIIAPQLSACPPIVFETLIPPLLALSGMPPVGTYQPAPELALASDLDIADLASTALSLLAGKLSLSSLLLTAVRQSFNEPSSPLRLSPCMQRPINATKKPSQHGYPCATA